MISTFIESALVRFYARFRPPAAYRNTRFLPSLAAIGSIHFRDTGGEKPCLILAPDGPNVVSHYDGLFSILQTKYRVICFDMPGFGHSLPSGNYNHSLDAGAHAILSVMNALHVQRAVLAFSCANGLYAIRVAQIAPDRVSRLVLSQTPSLGAMHAWSDRTVPKIFHVPVLGQILGWLFRHKAVSSWYRIALPKGTDASGFRQPAIDSLSCGGCFCLAGVVQGLAKDDPNSLRGVTVPCTMFWGKLDRSHRATDPNSLRELLPHAEIIELESSGHFPDLEQPERFSKVLMELVL
jgi:pimeloyl-ACP methyl ester carboxylesterase